MSLTVYYDGSCPICVREMRHIKRHDNDARINLVNVLSKDFAQRYPHIDPSRAMQILHAETDRGEILLGVDANIAAWHTVKRKSWLKILRWPVIKPVADMGYLFFARYRYQISRFFLGKARCEHCHIE